MTFLPIVERELRAAARRSGTYWTRLLVAGGAIAIGVTVFLASLIVPGMKFGKILFWALGSLALLTSLLAGRRSTADCISEEKREGTLGLLFLTDLKGYDVVAGKLVATSLGALYGLLAVFPVLALPLLVGGMTNGEFWRMVLVLLDTFLFSLAIGMVASSFARDVRTAMGTNFLLLLILCGALPVAWAGIQYYFTNAPPVHVVPFYSCPIYPFVMSDDTLYRMRPDDFWFSVSEIHVLTWAMVLLSCWVVPRSWQDRQAAPKSRRALWRQFWHAFSYGPVAGRAAFRKQALDVNAYYWLAGRARLKPMHVWLFLGLGIVWWLVGWWLAGDLWLDEANPVVTAIVLNAALKLWIAPESTQQICEDRQHGAMELLLSTPLRVRDMVRGQWLALRRQFVRPVLVVLAVELMLMLLVWQHDRHPQVPAFWLAWMIMLPADMLALGWVGMAMAMTAKTPSRATLNAVWRVLNVPWLLFGAIVLVVHLWYELFSDTEWSPGWVFHLSLWFVLGLSCDVVYGWQARHALRTHFRQLASEGRAPAVLAAAQPVEKSASKPSSTPPQSKPAPRRRWKWAVAAVLVAGLTLGVAGYFLLKPPRVVVPPPVQILVTRNIGPLRVFPFANGGAFIVLQDGSLWEWGQWTGAPFTKPMMPVRVGTNCDWLEARGAFQHSIGLRSDGTIWEWGRISRRQTSDEPRQVGDRRDWMAVDAGYSYAVALRRDGTLWSWGDNSVGQLGIGTNAPRNQADPVQIGTNNDWTAVSCQTYHTFALRKDGTLWVWGQFWGFPNGGMRFNRPVPTQVCLDTNWAGLSADDRAWGRTQSGEWWELAVSPPDATAGAESSCRMICTSSSSSAPAMGFSFRPKGPDSWLYEVRTNGTLWSAPLGKSKVLPPDWHQMGQRNDWVAVWGRATVFGLTTDGTLWTWGIDPARPPVVSFQSRLARLGSRLNGNPNPPMSGVPAYQEEPRPFMRIILRDGN